MCGFLLLIHDLWSRNHNRAMLKYIVNIHSSQGFQFTNCWYKLRVDLLSSIVLHAIAFNT